MKSIFIFLSLSLLTACISSTTTNSERTTASSRDIVTSDSIKMDQACNPQYSSAPLEMVVDSTRDTLTLKRDGKTVRGFPVLAVASGLPDMDQQSPETIIRTPASTGGASQENVFQLPEGYTIQGSPKATNYKSWREERQVAYKNRNTGMIAVEPRQMTKVLNCASKFANENIKVTVHR